MKSLLLLLLLLCAACATDDPDGSTPSGATALPITSNSGPDIVDVKLRCIEDEQELSMKLSLDLATTGSEVNYNGTAAVMVGENRMAFELYYSYEHGFTDYVRSLQGREEAMRSVCNKSLVDLLDLRITTSEGTTTVAKVRVAPAWQ